MRNSPPQSTKHLTRSLHLRLESILEPNPQRKEDKKISQLHSTLGELRSSGNSLFLFGGMLRDLLTGMEPRDVDLVVSDEAVKDIDEKVSRWNPRRNRYGGLNFKNDGWEFDLWPLGKTWAFHHYPVGSSLEASFDCLPRTTFLNVEAIAMQLWPSEPNGTREVFEHGFFSAFRTRTVEINYEHNPSPEYCVVRSLLVAQRLRFKLGPKLVQYIAKHADRYTMQEFARLQGRHYGRTVIVDYNMNKWLEIIHRHAATKKKTALPLIIPGTSQLSLFKNHQMSLWSSAASDCNSKY
ncbi:hypothetical protein ACVWYF_000053 [Hymenobacter sp. UYAg731]